MSATQKSFSVVIEPKGWTFDAQSAMPLLLAAQQAYIRLPSSCRNGTCRTCMCRLVSGTIRYHIAWPGLSVDEKREGFILPCVAHPESNLVIEERRAAQSLPVILPYGRGASGGGGMFGGGTE